MSGADESSDRSGPEDQAARDRLVERHLHLARRAARRYRGRGVDEDDLVQVGALALTRAAERYDPDRGASFATFATRTIDGEIKRWFRDHSWTVRPPRGAQEAVLRVQRAEEELRSQLGRAPRIAELAGATGLSTDEVLEAREAATARRGASLDAPTGDGDAPPIAEFLGSADGGFAAAENRMLVERLLAGLDARDRRIVEARFVERRSQQEIADELGVSQSYLSRVLRGILRDLREQVRGDPRF